MLRVSIGIIIIVAASGFVYWSHRITPDAVRKQENRSLNPVIQPAFLNEPLSVTLFYPRGGMLVSDSASVKRKPDAQAQAREALAAIFLDQRAAQAPVLRDVRLRAFFLDSQGTAYIDLTPGQEQAVRSSAWDEQLAIYSIVNTLTKNFDEIKRVVFLVDGRETLTLAGHMDLSRTYTKRMDLVKQ